MSSSDELIPQTIQDYMHDWLKRYPADKQRSGVVELLLQLQYDNNGFLTEEKLKAAAEFLSLSDIQVYEIATFYDMFELNPIGKHKIGVCTNVSCALRGSGDIVACLEKRLGIKLGETTKDGMFTLRETECLGACANAPVCQHNNKHYVEDLTVEKIERFVDSLQNEEQA